MANAFAYTDGLILIASDGFKPGAKQILFASGEREGLEGAILAVARRSRSTDDLLVPGIPEAENLEEALAALNRFCDLLKKRPGIDVVFNKMSRRKRA